MEKTVKSKNGSASGRRGFFKRLVASPEVSAPMTMRKDAHGDDVSLLGFGMMRLPTVDGKNANNFAGGSKAAIDQEEVNDQIDYALEHGVNYFDTSPAYCRGESEAVTGTALARHPRERYKIATKLSNFAPAQYPLEKAKAMFADSLKRLRTEYVDYYLLHAVGMGGYEAFSKRYVENGAIEYCLRERDAGRIRNLGFSFHGDKKAWDYLMDRHDKYHWDFVQIQLNYVDWKHAYETNKRNQDAEFLYNECVKRDIPVVVMEPLLGGRLARFNYSLASKLTPLDPEASLAKWALRFAGHHPKVMTVLSGMTYREHLEENCAIYSPLKPLSEKELAALEAAAQDFIADKTVPCNACNYCMPCPYGIDIPGILELYNAELSAENPDWRRFLKRYETQIPYLRQANHCIGCARCMPHCPQAIDIPAEMRRIDEMVESLKRKDLA